MTTLLDTGTVADFIKAAEKADGVSIYAADLNKYFALTDREMRECVSFLKAGAVLHWMIEEGEYRRVSLFVNTGPNNGE